MILSNRQNRAMQRSHKRSYWNNSAKRFPIPNKNYLANKKFESTEKVYSDSGPLIPYDTIIALVVITLIGIYFIYELNQQPAKAMAIDQQEIISSHDLSKKKIYLTYLQRGKRYLNKGKYDLAIKDFSVAKRMFESKEANFLMGVALSSNCTAHGLNCPSSLEYHEYLISSKLFSIEEIEILERSIKSASISPSMLTLH